MNIEKQIKAVVKVMRPYQGAKRARSVQHIAAMAGIEESHPSCPATRKVIRLIKERGILPVGSTAEGYYTITTDSELRSFTYSLVRRMKAIQANIDATHRAYYGDTY